MKRNQFSSLCAIGALLVPAMLADDAVVSADTFLNESNRSVNYGTSATLSVGLGNSALIQFDLSALQALKSD
jgi:hypothetical protein